jgi:CheY-like chemotaxis protein
MILDLNFAAIDPLRVIQALKANASTKGVRLVGYVSHVQVDLKKGAQEAGLRSGAGAVGVVAKPAAVDEAGGGNISRRWTR